MKHKSGSSSFVIVILAGLSLLFSCNQISEKKQKPNILFLFADDQRAGTINALGNDEHTITFEYYPVFRDPNIQQSPWDNPNNTPFAPETAVEVSFKLG